MQPLSAVPEPAHPPEDPEADGRARLRREILTWANLVTAVRTVACVVIFAVAALEKSATLNFVGLGVYWLLDIVDGWLARALKQETRFGAQLDILADRLLVAFFYLNYLVMNPGMVVPIALFLVQFMWIDHYISNQFMRWPVISPNYFHRVDELTWQLNWSWWAKLVNTGLVTVLIVATGWAWLCALVSAALIGVKVYSLVRMTRLPVPEPRWPESMRARAVVLEKD